MQTWSSLTIFKNCVDLFIAKRRSGWFLMGDYVKGSYYWVTAEKAWPCATGGRRSVFMNGRHYYSYSGTQCVSNASCCASGSLLSSEYFVCRYKSHMSALLWFYKILTIWNTTNRNFNDVDVGVPCRVVNSGGWGLDPGICVGGARVCFDPPPPLKGPIKLLLLNYEHMNIKI